MHNVTKNRFMKVCLRGFQHALFPNFVSFVFVFVFVLTAVILVVVVAVLVRTIALIRFGRVDNRMLKTVR